MKTFIKELFIILLILVAIFLVLGVFLYDYIPTNKIVPKIEQYQAPNTIKQELEDYISEEEEQKTQIVYEIDGTDYLVKINLPKMKILEKVDTNMLIEEGYRQTKKYIKNKL